MAWRRCREGVGPKLANHLLCVSANGALHDQATQLHGMQGGGAVREGALAS